MWWAPRTPSRLVQRERSPALTDGGSTAASELQPSRCGRPCGESPWWCACAHPGQGPPSWPNWPSSSLMHLSPWPGSPPPGTASSFPSITSATCARVRRGRHQDRGSGQKTFTIQKHFICSLETENKQRGGFIKKGKQPAKKTGCRMICLKLLTTVTLLGPMRHTVRCQEFYYRRLILRHMCEHFVCVFCMFFRLRGTFKLS